MLQIWLIRTVETQATCVSYLQVTNHTTISMPSLQPSVVEAEAEPVEAGQGCVPRLLLLVAGLYLLQLFR